MLLNYIDESGDGMINWEEFSKKLQSRYWNYWEKTNFYFSVSSDLI